jgi:hypothetical protein
VAEVVGGLVEIDVEAELSGGARDERRDFYPIHEAVARDDA